MEAKDTVMGREQLEAVVWREKCTLANRNNVVLAVAQIQAEIFFKAGVREVVNSLDWGGTQYQTMEGSPIIQIQISEADWQAKLKEWGIKGE